MKRRKKRRIKEKQRIKELITSSMMKMKSQYHKKWKRLLLMIKLKKNTKRFQIKEDNQNDLLKLFHV